MDKNYTENNFLAKWLNDELTDTEKRAFEKTAVHKEFDRIARAATQFKTPEFDREKVFQKIQQEIVTNKVPKVKKLVPNWVFAVAASVAVLLGVFFFMEDETAYHTSFGEQLAVVLPDGSEVQLNAKSSLMYSEDAWAQGERNLTLKGEGYFKVEKGSKFTVKTNLGTVSVLGTQFNVKTQGNYFNVKCFEGKVLVENTKIHTVLTPGKGVVQIANTTPKDLAFSAAVPNWISGETTFNEAPLSVVLEELENQFNINIDASNIDVSVLYTGSFTNQNQSVALRTVFIPLQIEFQTNESGKVILSAKK